jgi:heavy metal translocating P-type ATPase
MPEKKHHLSSFSLAHGSFYFWFDLALIAVSIFVILENLFHLISGQLNLLLLVAASIIGFLPVAVSAARALFRRRLTIDLLAGIALTFSLLTQEWHSAVFIGLMLASARVFVRYTTSRARRSIESLIKLRPTKVHVLLNGKIVETGIENVKVGDLIAVDSGQRVAVDGIVESGQASIDQSSLTGESEPINKIKGDQVLSSTLNIGGSIVVKARKVGLDTTFSKILELVEKSQAAKSPIASIAERFTSVYILVTIVGAAALYYFSNDLSLTLSVLLVTCADDLAVAIPLSLTAAIGAAAKRGIIIKGGDFIEGLTKIKTVVFDKTGTITEGKPKIKEIITFNQTPRDEFLSLLGAVENESEHPTAKAIFEFVSEKKIPMPVVSQTNEQPGFGIKGLIDNQQIFAGKLNFLESNGVRFSESELAWFKLEKEKHRTITILAKNTQSLGFVSLSDAIKPAAKKVIADLKNIGIKRLVVLTGDNEKIAEEVTREVGIPEFKANLMPQDKIDFLKSVLNPKEKVVMVGDGVNDAAALSLADVGIAMGAIGSDAAIESADIVLMKDDLSNLPESIKLARYTMQIIKQDLWIWGAANVFGLILVFLRILGPTEAAAYNFLTDFLPLFNSLRLFRLHLKAKSAKL